MQVHIRPFATDVVTRRFVLQVLNRYLQEESALLLHLHLLLSQCLLRIRQYLLRIRLQPLRIRWMRQRLLLYVQDHGHHNQNLALLLVHLENVCTLLFPLRSDGKLSLKCHTTR